MTHTSLTAQQTLDSWKSIIEDRKNSGQTIKEYCCGHNIKTSTYYYWQRKIRAQILEEEKSSSETPAVCPKNEEPESASQECQLHGSDSEEPAQSAVIFNMNPNAMDLHRGPLPVSCYKKRAALLKAASGKINDVYITSAPILSDPPEHKKKDRFTDVPITIQAGRIKVLVSRNASPDLISLVVGSLSC